jgi:hypothetical protein
MTDRTTNYSPEEVEAALSVWREIQADHELKLQVLKAAIRRGSESGPGIAADDVFDRLLAADDTVNVHHN